MTSDSPATMKPKYGVRDALRQFLPDYMTDHKLSPHQEKAAFAIRSCKTGELGYNVSRCTECGHIEIHACSCNNRNCPCCQYPLEQKWIAERNSELIPGISYYHVVFTVPHELNGLIEANPKEMHNLMFRAAMDSLITLCADKQWLGAKPGIVAVLHTWGQMLNFHPHVHTMVTGGGLTKDKKFVEGKHKGFLIPDAVLSPVFRGKYLDGLKKLWKKGSLAFPGKLAHLSCPDDWKSFIDSLYKKRWMPFLKETFNGNGNAVKYLARYAYRTAISNSRIDNVDEDGVTFHYKDYRDGGAEKYTTITGLDFVADFLRHILPSGFQRVRFGGFLANNVRSKNLALIHKLRNKKSNENSLRGKKMHEVLRILFDKDICKCPKCGKAMQYFPRVKNLPRDVPLPCMG